MKHNRNNQYNVARQDFPQGYCVAGIVGLLMLFLFGRLLLFLAVIGGIGWLAWKFRWAIRYYFGRFLGMIDTWAQAYQQKCRKNQPSHRYDSSQYSNPFRTSRQYRPKQTIHAGWNTDAASPAGRRNVIFDVTPEKVSK